MRALIPLLPLALEVVIAGCGNPHGAASNHRCDPNYQGACLDPDAVDYDCAGGSGDGPRYTGLVRVVGSDVYDLDRDGDGTGCD